MGLRLGGGLVHFLWHNTAMLAVEVQQYVNRARDFLKGMDLLKEDPKNTDIPLRCSEFIAQSLIAMHCASDWEAQGWPRKITAMRPVI